MAKPCNARLRLLGVFILLAFSIGCSRGQNDFQLKTAVQNKISDDDRLKMPLQVRVDHGVVILSGTVNSASERVAADQDAAQVEGVKVVADNLKLIDPIRPGTAEVIQKPKPSVEIAGPGSSVRRTPKPDQPAMSTTRPRLQAVSSLATTEPPVSISEGGIASDSRVSAPKPPAAPSEHSRRGGGRSSNSSPPGTCHGTNRDLS